MNPFAIKPLPAVAPPPKAVAELHSDKATAFMPCADIGPHGQPRRGTRQRGELEGSAEAGAEPSDEVLVVRFEPVAMRAGQVLVVAHVVGARLSELCAQAEEQRQSRVSVPLPEVHARIEVELQAEDSDRGRALIQVHDSALGPMSLELRLERGQLFIHASVSSARAAEALISDQALLERALRLQGVELGSLSVEVARRRSEHRRVTAVARSEQDADPKKEG